MGAGERTVRTTVLIFRYFLQMAVLLEEKLVLASSDSGIQGCTYYSGNQYCQHNYCRLPPLPLFVALRPKAGYGLLIREVSRSHTTTHHSQ